MKRFSTGPALHTVVLQLNECFYVLRVTRGNTMRRLLGECDNGKGGKSSFIGTTPVAVKKKADLVYLQKYILEADKLWGKYKPKKFNSWDEALVYLKHRKNINPISVPLYEPDN